MLKKIARIKSFLFIIIFILLTSLSIWFSQNYNISQIQSFSNEIQDIIEENYILSIIIVFLITIIASNSPVPLIAPLQLTTGFLFGIQIGLLINIISTFCATLAGFSLSRFFLRDFFKKILHKKLPKFEKEIAENGFYYIIGARILPVIPYFLINYLSGISSIKFKKYAFASFFGVIPTALIYTYLGSSLSDIESIKELISFKIFMLSVVIAFISQLPLIYKKFKYNPKIKKSKKIHSAKN